MVLAHRTAILTDGRYTLQAPAPVDRNPFNYRTVLETIPAEWLKEASGRVNGAGNRVLVVATASSRWSSTTSAIYS